MHAADLPEEFFKRTGTIRTDLLALSGFFKAREADGQPGESAIVNLFWEMWQPRLALGDAGEDNPQDLAIEFEDPLIEELARLERECRIPYKPDSEVWERLPEEVFGAALQYVHVGAASALRRRKSQGFTDDVVETLQEVSRILYLLSIRVHRDTLAPADFMEASSVIVSLFGVKALVDRELAHVNSLDGRYQESFDLAFDSFVSAEDVWEAVDWDDMGPLQAVPHRDHG